ncbi:hypothetical protein EII17_08090 [Clostridiales bacterium COT073_COT-073]|nr:hypothetical protein EII17_08090 [Clostridiales bacterium COT073_COT-073]
MRVTVETVFECSAKWLFEEVQKTSSFLYITAPLMKFVPCNRCWNKRWKQKNYEMKMFLFGVLPLGKYWICIEKDLDAMTIRDNGKGDRISKWDHLITIAPLGEQKTKYCDQIDIEAGVVTVFVYLFVQLFYRYRQSRWRKWIREKYTEK